MSGGQAIRPDGGGTDRPPWQPWAALALFSFLLNLPWEFLQVPFYRGLEDARHWDATLVCVRATAGDSLITLAAYGAVAGRSGRWWLSRLTAARLSAFVAAGVGITAVIEVLSVHTLGRWAYADGVPVLLGVGLPPFLQWLTLPPIALWLARRHLAATVPHPRNVS